MRIIPDAPDHEAYTEKNRVFIAAVLILYSLVLFTGIAFHPLWRDEMHVWLQAANSGTLQDVLQKKAFDGHPDLWYIVVYGISLLTGSYFAMQITHGLIAAGTAFLILRFAPFTRLQKVLLLSGYFFLFEYSIISREYGPGLLLLTVFLILYRNRTRLFFPLTLVLTLFAQSSPYGLILSCAFAITLLFEFTFSPVFRKELSAKKGTVVISLILFAAGLFYSVTSIMPPSTSYYASKTHFTLPQLTLVELVRSVGAIWAAWFPMPKPGMHFWNTNLIGSQTVRALLALTVLTLWIILFSRRRVVQFLLVTGSSAIVLFIFLYYFGYLRHHGHFFILLFACLWMYHYFRDSDFPIRPSTLDRMQKWLACHFNLIVAVLFSFQTLAGIYAVAAQFLVPFSAARQTAVFIRESGLGRCIIAGDSDVSLIPVAGYLDKEVFFFSRRTFSRYLTYDNQRKDYSQEQLLQIADSLSVCRRENVLLVLNNPLPDSLNRNVKRILRFERSIVPDEKYYLYLLFFPDRKEENSTVPVRE